MKERTKLLIMVGLFALTWFLPVGSERYQSALLEAFSLARWYAREHVLLCLIPAFFIAGAISVFVSQGAVMKYLGPKAAKIVAYPVAATSGTILPDGARAGPRAGDRPGRWRRRLQRGHRPPHAPVDRRWDGLWGMVLGWKIQER